MDTQIIITVITAAFTLAAPVVIQWRKTPNWSTLLKVGMPVLVSLIIAIAYLVASGGLAGLSLLEAFLIVYGLQQLVYSTIVKNIDALKGTDGRHEADFYDEGLPLESGTSIVINRTQKPEPIFGTTLDLGAAEKLPHDPEQ